MSVNQWKLLNQLKDSLSRLSNDVSFQNVFGKDISHFVQKLPSTGELFRYFEQHSTKAEVEPRTGENLPSVASNSVKAVVETKDDKKEALRKWKRSDAVSACTISSQTEHVISSLESAENEESLLNRLEAFICHIKQFPEGRNSAIKIGAIRLLLQIRSRTTKNDTIQGCVREGLALLGYVDPVPGKGVRILAMDGGGIRGLLVLEMLKKLEELTGKRTHELFDLFCGVSTGAILSFSLGIHRKNLDEIGEAYKKISMEVFKQSTLWGTGNLVWSQSYYDTALWESKLRDRLGTCSLISTSRDPDCPKLCAVSAVVNRTRLSAYVFRNYSLPWRVKSHYFGSSEHEVWQAARASAAAPTYFEEFKLGNFLHQDGGILVNNPTAVALHEAKLIWPNTPIQCVVSFGTGRSVPTDADMSSSGKTSNNTSWADKFYKILDSATDTEGVHITLNDLLPGNVYYRFNPYLTELIRMIETDPKKLEQLEKDAIMYLRRNEDKFHQAAKVLTEKKTLAQKTKDFVNLKRDTYGF